MVNSQYRAAVPWCVRAAPPVVLVRRPPGLQGNKLRVAHYLRDTQEAVTLKPYQPGQPAPAEGSHPMLFLINHRYPVLGAVLSALSNIVFLALGLAEHSALLIVMSAPFLALSVVQFVYRRRRSTSQAGR
jgi:uncharacterized membrane protein